MSMFKWIKAVLAPALQWVIIPSAVISSGRHHLSSDCSCYNPPSKGYTIVVREYTNQQDTLLRGERIRNGSSREEFEKERKGFTVNEGGSHGKSQEICL